MTANIQTYEGRPCKRCGGTTRYTSNGHCIYNSIHFYQRQDRQVTERQVARSASENTYNGRPCKVCGETLRFTKSARCVKDSFHRATPKHRVKPAIDKKPATTYNGVPCGKCGGTLRFVTSRNCVPCARAYRKTIRGKYVRPERCLVQRLLTFYGMSLEQYNDLKTNQDNRCAICKNVFIKTPCVDHNHETSKVRGLLCNNCNTAIGFLKDNPQFCRNAAIYLESSCLTTSDGCCGAEANPSRSQFEETSNHIRSFLPKTITHK